MKFIRYIRDRQPEINHLNSENLISVYKKNEKLIDDLVEKSLSFMFECAKEDNKNTSIYLPLKYKSVSLYARGSSGIFNKFGHNSFCISNINLKEKIQGKGVFSTYLVIMIALCLEYNWILYVENPLEQKFRSFLKRIGFVNFHGDEDKTLLPLGDYFFLLPDDKLISKNKLFSIENYNS